MVDALVERNGTVQLDKLGDHDLLVRAVTKLEDLPCADCQQRVKELETRTGALENSLTALRIQGGILGAIATGVSMLVGIFVKP